MRRRVRVGPAARVKRGAPALVMLGQDERGLPRQAIVLRDGQGALRAYLNLCRHIPVPLDALGGRAVAENGLHLVCHTHGAVYRTDDGLCIEGPCEGLSLHSLEFEEDPDGVVWLVEGGRT